MGGTPAHSQPRCHTTGSPSFSPSASSSSSSAWTWGGVQGVVYVGWCVQRGVRGWGAPTLAVESVMMGAPLATPGHSPVPPPSHPPQAPVNGTRHTWTHGQTARHTWTCTHGGHIAVTWRLGLTVTPAGRRSRCCQRYRHTSSAHCFARPHHVCTPGIHFTSKWSVTRWLTHMVAFAPCAMCTCAMRHAMHHHAMCHCRPSPRCFMCHLSSHHYATQQCVWRCACDSLPAATPPRQLTHESSRA